MKNKEILILRKKNGKCRKTRLKYNELLRTQHFVSEHLEKCTFRIVLKERKKERKKERLNE